MGVIIIIYRDSTWRYPNAGFWAVHAVSLAAMGLLAYKAMDRHCGMGFTENMSYPEQVPQTKEPQEDQF
ncbi:hypothetical protein [Desulforamulus aquiferis]|uniref:Uncharacterized protein n=1 Tax=Desulforamulus aquiferis TaxID=1397668 RepID=A0AAW7ZDR6_9FIRM|nr:hypothetical protein [Desulforamulus aquiferis]MDO7787462.1 hypothetical protein [Desulforamulus aquiferis]RYD05423.1 hypothetical protein N752_08750 [Desulforamulus aquiferis]